MDSGCICISGETKMVNLKYKGEVKVPRLEEKEGVPVLVCPLLERTGIVKHGFSTRLGGVSKEHLSSMNLSFTRGDEETAVKENYRRMAKALGIEEAAFTFSQQTHTTNVRVVTKADRGKGLVRQLDYTDVDGLITNEPGICLTTFYADCVPLFFVDPVKRVIGLSHSGWRGTVNRMGKVTVEKMAGVYGSKPEDIYAAIGPSICQDCYEVSEDVIEEFRESFAEEYWNELFYVKENGKYQLDLWKANEVVLRESGILREHLEATALCTCCNPDVLFSHRASCGKRGNLAAFLMLQ